MSLTAQLFPSQPGSHLPVVHTDTTLLVFSCSFRRSIYKVLLRNTVFNMCTCNFFLRSVNMLCYCSVAGALNPSHTQLAVLATAPTAVFTSLAKVRNGPLDLLCSHNGVPKCWQKDAVTCKRWQLPSCCLWPCLEPAYCVAVIHPASSQEFYPDPFQIALCWPAGCWLLATGCWPLCSASCLTTCLGRGGESAH